MTSSTIASKRLSGLGFGALVDRLIEPSPAITIPAERRQARLLTSLLLAFMVIGMTVLIVLPLISVTTPFQEGPFIVLLSFVIPYGISRTPRYKIAAYLMLIVVALVCLAPLLPSESNGNPNSFSVLFYLLFPILLASMVLGKRDMLVTAIFAIAITVVMPRLNPDVTTTTAPLALHITGSVLLYVFLNHRDGLERDRQAELTNALRVAETVNAEIELKNQELGRANALIRENARLKSEFLATMSHELRTPLNAIRGFTSIMLEGMGGEVDEEAEHMLTRISSNGERLLNLINDVLDIAKIEAGRLELVSEPLHLRDMAKQWQQQMGVLAEQKDLDFEMNIDPTFPDVVYGDSQRVTQIATNLISNAIKFTKQGKITLNIGQDANHWILRVVDTGIGIPPHALNFIFEEFRQVDGSSKREFGGTGLGLSIVRNLCRSMGGTVLVTSELGKGSMFTALLPIVTTPQEVPPRVSYEEGVGVR